MARPKVTLPIRRAIEEYAEQGETLRGIAAKIGKRFKISISHVQVGRLLASKLADGVVAPSASAAEMGRMAPADRLEAQLGTLDQVLVQPTITPAIRARLLTTYSNLLDRASKMRGRDGKGERQFDGLADLMLSSAHADAARWSTAPGEWLADAVPRLLPELHEIAGALERVPAEGRLAAGAQLRPLLHRLHAILDAL